MTVRNRYRAKTYFTGCLWDKESIHSAKLVFPGFESAMQGHDLRMRQMTMLLIGYVINVYFKLNPNFIQLIPLLTTNSFPITVAIVSLFVITIHAFVISLSP